MPMENRPHILVVDDDPEIRSLLAEYLEKNGYRATTVPDGPSMKKTLSRTHVDLVVLDIMLPGDDGLTLCRDLRADSTLPVIMLTARGDAVDRIVGLEIGADDYLPKPFSPRELLVRIKNVLKRSENQPRDPLPREVRRYKFSGWTLDTTTRNLIDANGVVVPLSGVEYRLLAIMLSRPNRVLSRNQLMELTRGREADPFDRSIDVRVSRLRQILRDDAREPEIIKTVYGEGYVLGVTVEVE
jgi:two-component system OmpR family response regulator